ncbi:MAG: hypothetical protein ACYCT0_05570 [Sulfobacillus sp.]
MSESPRVLAWKNPRRCRCCSERFAGEEFLDAALRDAAGSIVARLIRLSAALEEEFSVAWPILRVFVVACSTLLRTISGRNQDAQFVGS